MFESDDYDQVLSQIDFPEVLNTSNCAKDKTIQTHLIDNTSNRNTPSPNENMERENQQENLPPQNHSKRKVLNNYFDRQSKRKFPGPAGLLSGTLEETANDSICHIEILSQDVDCSQTHLRPEIFESSLWQRLQSDLKLLGLENVESLSVVKQQAVRGGLTRGKAKAITGFVEAVDRSATNPLVILRDISGTIKCTLHRDAWLNFSPYIVPEYTCIILWRPTVLTRGSTYKKHYVNITLTNVLAIYCSAPIMNDVEAKPLPDGYSRSCSDECTVVKMDVCPPKDNDIFSISNNMADTSEEILQGLDCSVFLDDDF